MSRRPNRFSFLWGMLLALVGYIAITGSIMLISHNNSAPWAARYSFLFFLEIVLLAPAISLRDRGLFSVTGLLWETLLYLIIGGLPFTIPGGLFASGQRIISIILVVVILAWNAISVLGSLADS